MTDALGVHLVNKDGAILNQAGRPIVSDGHLEAGRYWVETFIFEKNGPEKFVSLRLAIFASEGNHLEIVSGTQTEWGGKVAVIPLSDICH